MSSLVWPKVQGWEDAPTAEVFRSLQNGLYVESLMHKVCVLKDKYSFFHWHLVFSDVFENGGFDCMMGTPISRFHTPKTSSSISATSIDSVVFLNGRKVGLVYSIHRACDSIVKTQW